MRRDALELGLVAWIEAALPALAEVRFERQPGATDPRPAALPYATVRVTSDARISGSFHDITTDETADAGATYRRSVRSWREAVARVRVYGDGAADLVRELDASKKRPAARDALHAAGLAVVGTLSVIDATTLQSASWERRAEADFSIRYRRIDDFGTDEVVDTIEVTTLGDAVTVPP